MDYSASYSEQRLRRSQTHRPELSRPQEAEASYKIRRARESQHRPSGAIPPVGGDPRPRLGPQPENFVHTQGPQFSNYADIRPGNDHSSRPHPLAGSSSRPQDEPVVVEGIPSNRPLDEPIVLEKVPGIRPLDEPVVVERYPPKSHKPPYPPGPPRPEPAFIHLSSNSAPPRYTTPRRRQRYGSSSYEPAFELYGEPQSASYGRLHRDEIPENPATVAYFPPRASRTSKQKPSGKMKPNLLAEANEEIDSNDPKIRDSLVLCVYRYSKKDYDLYRVSFPEISSTFNDLALFKSVQRDYKYQLRSWMRRTFSFKYARTVRLLQYGDGLFFEVPNVHKLFSPLFMGYFRNPRDSLDETSFEWVDWIRVRKNLELRKNLDIAIEIQEDYDPYRMVLIVSILIAGQGGLTAAWLIAGEDPAYVATVMSFVLGFVAVVALAGIWDWFDHGQAERTRDEKIVSYPSEESPAPIHIPMLPKAVRDFNSGQGGK